MRCPTVLRMFLSRGSVIVCRLYKLSLSYEAHVILQLTDFPILFEDLQPVRPCCAGGGGQTIFHLGPELAVGRPACCY